MSDPDNPEIARKITPDSGCPDTVDNDAAGIVALVDIEPLHVATHIEALQERMAKAGGTLENAQLMAAHETETGDGIKNGSGVSPGGNTFPAASPGGACRCHTSISLTPRT